VLGRCVIGAPGACGVAGAALVVGDSADGDILRLDNPVDDASDVTQSLERVGFKVTTIKDAGVEKLRVALLRGKDPRSCHPRRLPKTMCSRDVVSS
jgi:hypothetical protein